MKWEEKCFGDLYLIPSRNGLTKPSKLRGTGYKMINMGELFANDRIYDDIPMELVPLNDHEKDAAKINKNDLLFARQSLVLEGAGKCSIVMETSPLTVFESHLIRVRLDEHKADPLFYYYYFKSPYSPVKTIVSQCAQAGIRGTDLAKIRVCFPPIKTQKLIAKSLSEYDDLIENNLKQIRLLEETAQRLYKEWFVNLRFPGHENAQIKNGLPEGWRVTTINSVCKTVGGGTPSTKIKAYYENGNILWVTPTDITHNYSLTILDTATKITIDGLENSAAKMLPAEAILMTSRASVGYFGLCEFPVCTNQGFISCIPNSSNMQMYLLFNLMDRVDELRKKAGGSTYLELSKRIFNDLKIVVPDNIVLNEFQEIEHNILLKIRYCSKTIELAKKARDFLLPKLISGELEV